MAKGAKRGRTRRREPLVSIQPDRLRLAMNAAGLSFSGLSRKITNGGNRGVVPSILRRLADGSRSRTRKSVRWSIAEACGVNEAFLVGDEGASVGPFVPSPTVNHLILLDPDTLRTARLLVVLLRSADGQEVGVLYRVKERGPFATPGTA